MTDGAQQRTDADPTAQPFGDDSETAAAVDLGSNSFHMIVARFLPDGEVRVLDKIKHRVRLAGGLDEDGRLTRGAQARALDSLEKMGQRLRHLSPDCVRAVGTNTLRKARNGLPFLVRANRALGHRIEVISGREEARLVFLGVCHDMPDDGRRLVVDIGGGSTEVIVGPPSGPKALDSLYMGCVSWSRRFFPDGKVTASGMDAALRAARLQLQPCKRKFRELGWNGAVGSSGTIRAIERILRQNGLCRKGLTPAGLATLRQLLIDKGDMSEVDLSGLSSSRSPVLPGGLAVLSAVFESLQVEHMIASNSALREGVVYDLVGRRHRRDIRVQTVARVAERFGVDRAQAARVRATALSIYDQVARDWGLDADPAWRKLLGQAAELHEIGTFVSYSGYHKHGAYLLANGDLPGFARHEQEVLAALVLSHRRKLSATRISSVYNGRVKPIVRLAAVLRLARRLRRSRAPRKLRVQVRARGSDLQLTLPTGYLDAHPLTRDDLQKEVKALGKRGITLDVTEASPPEAAR